MVPLHIAILSVYFAISATQNSNCMLGNPEEICSGFTTQNDHIMSTKDACDMPAQRNVTMRPCGRDKISYDDCYQAGCCYKDGECYLPFVEEKVDYLFYSQKMRFKDARKECRKAGFYNLPCVLDDFDFSRVRSRSCGNLWLGGAHIEKNAAKKVPRYDKKTGNCSSMLGVSCKLYPKGYALALELTSDDSFFLSTADISERRPFLCVKEDWRPHIKTYPDNVSSKNHNKLMLCGLTFSGNVTSQSLAVEWELHFPNGTKTRLKERQYSGKQVAAQYYADSIRANVPGKYVCSFTFLKTEGDPDSAVTRKSWAYHYTDISCNVSVQGILYSNQSFIELQVEYRSDIIVSFICSGYPLPDIYWTIDVNGQGPENKPVTPSRNNLTISPFSTQGPLHDDVTYTVDLQPRSEITTLPNTTIRITKLPVPTECSVTLLTEPEDSGAGSHKEVFQISHPAVHKKINVTGSFEVIFWCTGYPKPNMTAYKITTQSSPIVEDLTSDISGLVAQWNFQDFASEVSLSEDYMITLNLTVTPPGDPPETLSLHFTKIPIPTSCSFNLSSNGTVIHDHSAVDVTDYHSVNTSSFADQNFELDVFCTGYPAPNITAVILTEKEDSEPIEFIDPRTYQQNFKWKLQRFASEAAVAQDYVKTLTLTTSSGDHSLVEMVLTLRKTIIKFDVEIPDEVLTVKAPEVLMKNDSVGDIEPIVGQITLPCKGATGPSFPTPSAFWKFNEERLDLDTEMGQHIRFKHEEKSNIDATIIISTGSSIVAGQYRCVILIDNTFTNNYDTKLIVELPPVPPGPTLITKIEGTEAGQGEGLEGGQPSDFLVRAASFLQPSYQFVGNLSFTGFLFDSGGELITKISNTTISEDKVHGVFNVPLGSGKIRVGFKASSEHGDSELSQSSDELEILPETPRSSVTKIERDKETTSSSLSLTFNEIPNVEEYEVRIFSSDGTLLRTFTTTDNQTDIQDLEPQTSYSIEVRGVNTVDGGKVYGPNSLKSSFTTAPNELPAPSNLQGQPLESDGNKSAVLLTWTAAKVSSEFIDGYLLYIKLVEDKTEDTDSLTRRRRQALQTLEPIRIPFGARAKVIKGLDSGTRYEFILQSYSSDFGESEPATVTVQTLTAGPCPYAKQELYPPRHCEPRVSIDREYLYIKFYFDCYSGNGTNFRGKHSQTPIGECATWTEDNLKQFPSAENKPEIGTNYCRNIEGSTKDGIVLHDKPWCYLADGSNHTCTLRPCQDRVDETCYQGTGHSFRGLGYNEECASWREEHLEEYLVYQHDEQIVGTRLCRNWQGSNMTKPWCYTEYGDRAECPIPHCGEGVVTFQSESSTKPTFYTITDERDFVCIKLDQSEKVDVGVQHGFGTKNCQSEEIKPQVTIPPKIRTTDRLWVRYLLVELFLTVLVVSLWSCLLYRKRIIQKQTSATNGRSTGTTSDMKKGTATTQLSSFRTSRSQIT